MGIFFDVYVASFLADAFEQLAMTLLSCCAVKWLSEV
jgi:hypothetical protein